MVDVMDTTDSPDDVIITCAVVGATRANPNPNHPTSFDEIVRESVEAARSGAAALHLHARTRAGEITQDTAVYAELADAIRSEVPDVILNFTTGGSKGMTDDERFLSLDAGPEVASLDCGSMNFGDHDVFLCSPEFIQRGARLMTARGIRPELECFDAGMVLTAERLVREGLGGRRPFFQLVLGVKGGAPANVESLSYLRSLIPGTALWAATGIGRNHFRVMAATLAMGGHLRTGLEDVAYTARGVYARSNAELVERAVALSQAVGRSVASPRRARELLSLAARPG
jgi:3-keto-5-aminohexanoate cleavage enzyme